jgi:hypothetical protein
MPAVTSCDTRYGGRGADTADLVAGGVVGLCTPAAVRGLGSLPAPAGRCRFPEMPDGGSLRVSGGCARAGPPFAYRAMYVASYAKGFAAAVAAAAAVEMAG